MNFRFHFISERFVYHLVTLNQRFTLKNGINDDGIKVRAVALHRYLGSWKAIGDPALYVFGCYHNNRLFVVTGENTGEMGVKRN